MESTTETPANRTWRDRPGRFFLFVLVVALLLAAVERGVRAVRAPARQPERGASWIWAADSELPAAPVAFYAARDFELAEPGPAQISIAADEGYDLFVNGEILGSNSYRTGMAIDRYPVGDLLRAGTNRILVRLRSQNGAGGLLVALVDSDPVAGERALLVTDGDWRIFRNHERRLFRLDRELEGGEPPRVWQRAPTGRWRLAPAEGDRPRLVDSDVAQHYPRRVRNAHPSASWVDVRRGWRRLPVSNPQLLLDWGREVEGLLAFGLVTPPSGPALAYFGAEPPVPEDRPADEMLIFVDGQTSWSDARVRRFRYVLLVGVSALRNVRVLDAGPEITARLRLPAEPVAGVFGVEPPTRPPKAQEAVWRRLYRAADERADSSLPVPEADSAASR